MPRVADIVQWTNQRPAGQQGRKALAGSVHQFGGKAHWPQHAGASLRVRLDGRILHRFRRIKLRGLDDALNRRREIAARYDSLLANAPMTLLEAGEGCEPAHHLYPIRVTQRDAIMEALRARGVETIRLDSSLTGTERAEALDLLEDGAQKIVLITPEGATGTPFK